MAQARRNPRPPRITDLAPTLRQIQNHAWRLYSLASDSERMGWDAIPEAEAVETVRRLVTQNLAATVKGLLYHIDVLNSRFKPGVAPLTETEEGWLRRQLEGLGGRGGAS